MRLSYVIILFQIIKASFNKIENTGQILRVDASYYMNMKMKL